MVKQVVNAHMMDGEYWLLNHRASPELEPLGAVVNVAASVSYSGL